MSRRAIDQLDKKIQTKVYVRGTRNTEAPYITHTSTHTHTHTHLLVKLYFLGPSLDYGGEWSTVYPATETSARRSLDHVRIIHPGRAYSSACPRRQIENSTVNSADENQQPPLTTIHDGDVMLRMIVMEYWIRDHRSNYTVS